MMDDCLSVSSVGLKNPNHLEVRFERLDLKLWQMSPLRTRLGLFDRHVRCPGLPATLSLTYRNKVNSLSERCRREGYTSSSYSYYPGGLIPSFSSLLDYLNLIDVDRGSTFRSIRASRRPLVRDMRLLLVAETWWLDVLIFMSSGGRGTALDGTVFFLCWLCPFWSILSCSFCAKAFSAIRILQSSRAVSVFFMDSQSSATWAAATRAIVLVRVSGMSSLAMKLPFMASTTAAACSSGGLESVEAIVRAGTAQRLY